MAESWDMRRKACAVDQALGKSRKNSLQKYFQLQLLILQKDHK